MIGINTPSVVRVEPSRGPITSFVPVNAASCLESPFSNLRAILSETTIALSTKRPIARASADIVNMFNVNPVANIAVKQAEIEIGIDKATTSEIRHPPINTKITTTTTTSAISDD